MRKIAGLFLVVTMLAMTFAPTTVGVSQTENGGFTEVSPISKQERLLLIEALMEVEQNKTSWGLDCVDFDKMYIGYPIHTYNYVNGELISGYNMYPLTVNNKLVLFAILNNGQFQITRGLVKEINASVDSNTPVALVYDNENAHIYANQSFSIIHQFDQKVEGRDTLKETRNVVSAGVETMSLSQSVPLNYREGADIMQRSMSANYSCNVTYVTQHPYDNLCWAATVACIVNYVRGTSLDAATVARNYYGNTNFDRSITRDNLTERIREYGLSYYQFSKLAPFDDKILDSILADNPVGGAFDVIEGDNHATTIFAVNPIAGRIQVMDPEYGATTAIYAAATGYSYVSSYANTTLVLYAISYDDGT